MEAKGILYAAAVALVIASSPVHAQEVEPAENNQSKTTVAIAQSGDARTFAFGYAPFQARLIETGVVRVWVDEQYPTERLEEVQGRLTAAAQELFQKMPPPFQEENRTVDIVIRNLSKGTLAKTWYGQPREIFVDPEFLAGMTDERRSNALLQATLYHEWFHLKTGEAIAQNRTEEEGKRFFLEIRNLDELAARVATASFLLRERERLSAYVQQEYERRFNDALVAPAVQHLTGFESTAMQGDTPAEIINRYGDLNTTCFTFLCQRASVSVDDAVSGFLNSFDDPQMEQPSVEYLLEALAQRAIADIYQLAGTDEEVLQVLADFQKSILEVVASTDASATELWKRAWEQTIHDAWQGSVREIATERLSITSLAERIKSDLTRR